MIEVSVVIPLFNEENSINELYRRINGVLTSLKKNHEIVFIDDGSYDRTYDLIRNIQTENNRVKLVRFKKNRGQLPAILSGFEHSKGEVVINMDGDLQNDPEDIIRMLEYINKGYLFVNGWRKNRKDPALRKLCSLFANNIISYRTKVPLKDYGCGLFAVRRELLERLKGLDADRRFLKPLLARLTESVIEIEVRHLPRKKGVSKYNLFKIIRGGVDFWVNFGEISRRCPRSIHYRAGYRVNL